MAELHRVLIVGAGSIGERHLRCFLATGRAEIVLVEADAQRCRNIAERYGVANAFTEMAAGLAEKPNSAVIATPAPLHVAQAIRLAQSGMHLLIEKPLGTSLQGIEQLRETVREKRLTVAVAYVYRCHPLVAALREALRENRFGKPVELVMVAGQHFPTYRPAYRDIYYTDHAAGGGAIQDALTHLVNAGEWLVGPVNRLVVDGEHQVLDGVSVEDTVHVLARHGSVLASYSLNQYQSPNELTLTMVCERGTVRCEFHENRWRWMTQPDGPWTDERIDKLERDTIFIAQANGFLDAVVAKKQVHCTLDEGIQTLRVNLAALASLEQGSWQTIPQHLG